MILLTFFNQRSASTFKMIWQPYCRYLSMNLYGNDIINIVKCIYGEFCDIVLDILLAGLFLRDDIK